MPKIYIVVMIGIPGAGKTTFCENLIEINSKFNVVHICFDHFINTKNNLNSYNANRKKLINEIKNLINHIKNNHKTIDYFAKTSYVTDIEADYLILIDDNNYYRGMRYEFYKICKIIGAAFLQIYFPIQLEIALERNKKRDKGYVPENIIENMNKKLENPSGKCCWEIETINVNNDKPIDIKEILSYIKKIPIIKIPEIKEKVAVNQTKLHNIDIALRKHIKYLITEKKSPK